MFPSEYIKIEYREHEAGDTIREQVKTTINSWPGFSSRQQFHPARYWGVSIMMCVTCVVAPVTSGNQGPEASSSSSTSRDVVSTTTEPGKEPVRNSGRIRNMPSKFIDYVTKFS